MGLESFTFDGINSLDHNIFIAQRTVWNAPKRKVNMIEKPGKNGYVTIDEGAFENIQVTYSGKNIFHGKQAFIENIDFLRNEFCSRIGYKRLSDTYHPDEYRLAIYRSGLEVNAEFNNTASQFDIVFDCKPQRWLTSGELPVKFTANGSISNPTLYPAKPLIKVKGKGTLGISDWILTIDGLTNQTLYIDCDTMEVYKNTGGIIEGANSLLTLNKNVFPELVSGINNISIGSGITEVEITPNWWRI